MTNETLNKALKLNHEIGDVLYQIHWINETVPKWLTERGYFDRLPTNDCTKEYDEIIRDEVVAIYKRRALPPLEAKLAELQKELLEL